MILNVESIHFFTWNTLMHKNNKLIFSLLQEEFLCPIEDKELGFHRLLLATAGR